MIELSFMEFIVLIFSILQIILFFKLWKMTNDVKQIKDELLNRSQSENEKED